MSERPPLGSGIHWTDEKRHGFIRSLNEHLPTKRVIAQGLVRNHGGDVLLCELTYKTEWDLPGGVVDPGESPAHCVVRECREELGVELAVRSLLTTTWLPPYRGWDDAVLFLFDLGRVDATWSESLRLQAREIKAVHWVSRDGAADHVAPYAARLIASATVAEPIAYLENGIAPGDEGVSA